MQKTINTPEAYIHTLPEDRQQAITELRNCIRENLPAGFEEEMAYGMISYVVPHALYPAGYHCNPAQALPFISIASQKGHVAVYHMGLYADEELYNWFQDQYAQQSKTKADIGKSCIRFKKVDQIPFSLIGQFASKLTPQQWILLYEKSFKTRK